MACKPRSPRTVGEVIRTTVIDEARARECVRQGRTGLAEDARDAQLGQTLQRCLWIQSAAGLSPRDPLHDYASLQKRGFASVGRILRAEHPDRDVPHASHQPRFKRKAQVRIKYSREPESDAPSPAGGM